MIRKRQEKRNYKPVSGFREPFYCKSQRRIEPKSVSALWCSGGLRVKCTREGVYSVCWLLADRLFTPDKGHDMRLDYHRARWFHHCLFFLLPLIAAVTG